MHIPAKYDKFYLLILKPNPEGFLTELDRRKVTFAGVLYMRYGYPQSTCACTCEN
jgi:hypothetical protein